MRNYLRLRIQPEQRGAALDARLPTNVFSEAAALDHYSFLSVEDSYRFTFVRMHLKMILSVRMISCARIPMVRPLLDPVQILGIQWGRASNVFVTMSLVNAQEQFFNLCPPLYMKITRLNVC
jgi:hypothetical protein